MKKRTVRIFAGMLAAALICSYGGLPAYASEIPAAQTAAGPTTIPPTTEPPSAEPSQADGETQSTASSQTAPETPDASSPQTADTAQDTAPSQTAAETQSTAFPQTEATDNGQTVPAESVPQEEPAPSDEDKPLAPPSGAASPSCVVQPAAQGPAGCVEVCIMAGIEVRKDQNFQVMLNGSSTQTVTLAGSRNTEKAGLATAKFTDLASGDYTLRVTATGYLPYEQTIRVESLGYRIRLYTGRTLGFTGAHPGQLFYGDVNQDGRLDHSDADKITAAIEAGEQGGVCDLNGDGRVDLLDLQYFTEFSDNIQPQTATPETYIPLKAASVSVTDNTQASGDFAQGSFTLSQKDGSSLSESNPAEITFTFPKDAPAPMDGVLLATPMDSENAVEEGRIIVVYEENGLEMAPEYVDIPSFDKTQYFAAVKSGRFSAQWDENGNLTIDFGNRIAVKQVIFRITKTAKNTSLAAISSVEFVNDMESRIPEPQMNIPAITQVKPGNKSFTVSWNKETNVTGYEVAVSYQGQTEYKKTTSTSLTVSQFQNSKLINKEEYRVRVQSVNGEWKSGFGEERTVTPQAAKVPPAPDEVKVTCSYHSMSVRWKNAEDADSYNLYYKEADATTYQKIEGIEGLYYQTEGLKDSTKYMVYVTASNELGEGPSSMTAADTTPGGLAAAKLPAYKLINTSAGEGKLSRHIKSASVGGGGFMVDSPLDTVQDSALGLFDNKYTSYLQRDDWDYGGAYPGDNKGIFAELDQSYEIGMIAFAEPIDIGSYTYASVRYWDENGKRQDAKNMTLLQRKSGDRRYYILKFAQPLKTSKVQIGIGRYGSSPRKVTVSEIRFYAYDSIEQDILALYADDLQISLRKDVTKATIDELQKRLDTKDPDSNEYHPERNVLQKELDAARQLLASESLSDVIAINPFIAAAKDQKIAVGGLNAWQPLGVSAAAGDELIVYVGNPGMQKGASANVSLIYTQQHAESGSLSASQKLVIGRNEITVPKISSTDKEKGGALYIQYNGNNDKDQYAVRVSGGTKIPVLNVYRVSGTERKNRIKAYVQELDAYVASLTKKHQAQHQGGQNANVDYSYDERNCIFNVTDIVTDYMMLSIPASQVLNGLGSASREDRLSATIEAMENMLTLFYQHKGLTDSFAPGTDEAVILKNHLPYRYLNIRYMKMFAGAFMYAAGNHIGIEWPETLGMMGGVPVKSATNGAYESGQYFGWGIAHEIGHEINQGAYAHAEVTNNYFSVLAQAKDQNGTVRFQYPEVYKKVTSGSYGYAQNVFTQLGLYWQLHLAYDRDYNYKTYDTWQEIMEKRFFARVDRYARDPASAPNNLTLSDNRDQNLMRLASAAANRDLSEFFDRWGMVPDETTKSYMRRFAPEERAIYYVDDDSRVYEMENAASQTIKGREIVSASASADNSQATVTIQAKGSRDVIHGYEIVRIFTEQGKQRRQIAGFTQSDTFTDEAAFAANRVITYEVTAIDKFMNRSAACRTQAVKISGDGLQDKTGWTVDTNMKSAADAKPAATPGDPCEKETVSAIIKVIDKSSQSDATFTGKADGADPYIVLELNRIMEISALRYTCREGQPIGSYRIEVSTDGSNYSEVKSGSFALTQNAQTVYFENGNDPWVYTCNAAYVKLTAVGQQGQSLSVTELDLYGPSGDNVEFMITEGGENTIGQLTADYVYQHAADGVAERKIPAGSIVFTGSYKGNPAYNVVVLYDENGNIVGGVGADDSLTASQIILAPPLEDDKALLGETAEGTWVYWIENADASLPSRVRAELYRVDNALTNEGQRLVSDTCFVELPKTLPSITLSGK